MNQVVLMVEMGEQKEALSFQHRPILFDLDSRPDCARMGDLVHKYPWEPYSAERFPHPILAAEWFMRMGRGERPDTAQPAEIDLPADASEREVCLACGQFRDPDHIGEADGTTGGACTWCGQLFPDGHPKRGPMEE